GRGPAGRLVLALLLGAGGTVVVVVGGGGVEIQTVGIVLALCCAVAYSAYLISADRVMKGTNPMTSAMWLAAAAALANLVFAGVFGHEVVPRGSQWWVVIGMSAATVGAFVCMLAGLQRIGAVRNAIIGVLEPPIVALLAWGFLSEPIRLPVAIGGTLILGGASVATLSRRTARTEPNV